MRGWMIAMLFVSTSAYAETTAEDDANLKDVYASVPVVVGYTTRDGGALSGTFRPEVLYSPGRGSGLAFGPYLELGRNARDDFAGGGLTVTNYGSSAPNVSTSVGGFHRWTSSGETGLEASVLVGARVPRFFGGGLYFDFPLGVRVDYRDDLHADREVVVGVAVDLAMLGAIAHAHAH